jgi:hypothetical protein
MPRRNMCRVPFVRCGEKRVTFAEVKITAATISERDALRCAALSLSPGRAEILTQRKPPLACPHCEATPGSNHGFGFH